MCALSQFVRAASTVAVRRGVVLRRKEDRVILRDFEGDVGEKGKLLVFEFSRRNYDEVVSKVVSETNKRKQAEAKNKDVQ